MRIAELIPALIMFLSLAVARWGHEGVAAGSGADTNIPISRGIDQELRVPVGPPEATLAVWVIEPAKGTPIRGTVLLLHGFVSNHFQVANAGEALRHHGYRAVMVDLRGFGQSTGDAITFGVLDAQDLKQLTDYLQRHDLCGPTLGVYGTSYGAASAILYAAADPRVTAVVAVAPFADIKDEVPQFGRFLMPGARFLSDQDLSVLGAVAGKVANFDLNGSKPLTAITQTKARILLVHGLADGIISHQDSERLHAAAPTTSELMVVPNRGHIGLSFDVPGELQAPTREWFERYLATKHEGAKTRSDAMN